MKIIRPAAIKDSGAFSRASSATMWDKTGTLITVANDVPRFSYDPTDLTKPPCLLIEPVATNLAGGFGPSWFFNGGVVSASPSTDPTGATGAARWALSGIGDGYYMRSGQAGAGVMTDGAVHTLSVFFRYVSGTGNLQFGLESPSQYAVFNPVTLQVLSTTGGATIKFTNVGGGWVRAAVTFIPDSTGNRTLHLYRDDFGAALTVDMFGPQVEVGSVATSFILTTTGPVTRAADVNTLGLISTLTETDYPLHDVTKLYVIGDRVMDTSTGQHKVYESATGSTATVSISAASPCVVTWNGHGLAANTPVQFTSGTVPTGLALNTVYYVSSTNLLANSFQLVAAVNGTTNINTSGSVGSATARASTNYGKVPPNTDYWLDAGSTNKWAMFDKSVGSQTSNVGAICAGLTTPSDSLVDSIVLQNISGATAARVAMLHPVDGVVYDQTVSLISTDGITDPYTYCFEPIVRLTDVAFFNLPPYSDAIISIALFSSTGETVYCGLCLMGLSKVFGPTQSGMSMSSQDYSVKDTNDFGQTYVQERPFAKTMTLTAFIDRAKVKMFLDLLNSYRAIPVVYVGDDSETGSMQYGFYKEYSMGADYVEHATLHIEIESLT
jgi:hypothetical protein